jgi:hypothetical protein
MGFAAVLVKVCLGFRLDFQATGPRDAVLQVRIHGGIKARENNVEE